MKEKRAQNENKLTVMVKIETLSEEKFRRMIPELIRTYISAYQDFPEYAYPNRREVKRYLKWLFKGDPQGFFMAIWDSKTVGFIAVHSKWYDWQEDLVGEIHELAVDKRYQGKGIGKALIQEVVEYLKSKGRKRITLWVGGRNERAIKVYEKLGFMKLYRWGIWLRMILYT
ncbi:MAG: GNAT family N-acetyltransferase [Actinomycetota bacterium]|nr:GNAT family N-acetyltransferase [Actinomycetota bacterium]MDI6822315.1 GNAT family N-acetyltransferase [Actinomycetota bacterium]